MKDKRPAIMFYTGDWLKDPNLRRCTHAEKGVWIDMICLLNDCEERGVFTTGGRPWSIDEIAYAVGGDLRQTTSIIESLIAKGVASRRTDGAVFSRRMVRDEQTSRSRSDSGSKGGSKTQAKRQAKHKQTLEDEVADENEDAIPKSSSSKHRKNSVCTNSQARAIYDIYPHRVAPTLAVKAIIQAAERIADDKTHQWQSDPLTWLQRRTLAYAQSPRGQPPLPGEKDLRPYPATWFNQGRYDDDDSSWQQPNRINGPAGGNPPRQGRDDWRERKQAREHPHDEAGPASL